MIENWQLVQRQNLPLDVKIELSKKRIREWYNNYNGQVCVSFSGGKDSTVLLHLVRSIIKREYRNSTTKNIIYRCFGKIWLSSYKQIRFLFYKQI